MASNRCYREIRPAFESDAIPTSPTSPRNPHNASSPRSDQKPARRNVWVACESCKKRKIKCSADRPKCSQCTSRGFDCRYTADPSESRSASMKRKFTELERQNDCLNGFFRAIRSMPEFQAHEVLRRIRSGASAEDVLREVEGGVLLLQLYDRPERKHRDSRRDIASITTRPTGTTEPASATKPTGFLTPENSFESVSPQLPWDSRSASLSHKQAGDEGVAGYRAHHCVSALLEKKRSFYAEAIELGVWMDLGSDWGVRSHIVMRACDQNM
ncbi:hypothetical protein CGMCC3_g10324 [Colletotrichum fructicola]|uniref:Nitrogen assimilation transcription factor nirA n=2 Tax=Colletotrichum fructicola (strain Nara gc5) TaxID=1213859 RepID=A0A7J6J3G6_COLFN|nr:uncharacterized protein CGMCC3_g10324 [Colletotrichum fructicola]KAE9573537.1 hypothetical protein CGMCC3_g10324 [Colletotrichum fructicola]KAF4430354.1 Nitrogen assimilation transcription factor nirA [Colletotrichum fructicola]KAF4484380.1 Nitrogen assimilation transcription factor nirA [Colletotrichum fructicola Nara gc5]